MLSTRNPLSDISLEFVLLYIVMSCANKRMCLILGVIILGVYRWLGKATQGAWLLVLLEISHHLEEFMTSSTLHKYTPPSDDSLDAPAKPA